MAKKLIDLQKDFINLRLGSFIHFNSATFQFHTGDIEDWEFMHENGDQPRLYPFDEKDWNPARLDCDQWAGIAKAAGFRFMFYTAKHHEGFCTWPTQYTKHCVRNATNKTDVVAEYLRAFRAVGIKAGLYFSVLDLTAGINRHSCTEEQKEMITGEITELLTHYGEIPFLVLDGWNAPWGGPSYEMLPFEEIDSLVKSLQPDCLLLNIGCTDGLDHTDIVFFENGAGQEVTDGFAGPGVLCQKLTDTWFWRTKDASAAPKSADWAIGLMQKYFPVNVNLVLNMTPNTDGRIDDNLAAEYEKMGTKLPAPALVGDLPAGRQKRKQ